MEWSETPIERDEEFLRELRLLKLATFAAGAATLAFDLLLNYMGKASIATAALLTPAAIVFLMLSIFFHDSATSTPWEGRFRVESEFRRSSLMVFGAILVTIGGGFAISSFGGDVARVTIDMGVGTALIGTGLYVAWRYRW